MSGTGTRGGRPAPTGSKGRVLAAIRTADGPIGVEDLAADLELHPNTVRFHVESLEDAGLVEQGRQPTGGKGRPRAVCRPTAEGARVGERNYQLLATALVEHLVAAAPDPVEAAEAAGRTLGERLAAARGTRRRSWAGVVLDLLEELGFDPEPHPARRPTRIALRNCPFREVVDEHQAVVCAVHQGLLDGALSSLQTPDQADRSISLEPLTPPNEVCVVHLLRNGAAGQAATSSKREQSR